MKTLLLMAALALAPSAPTISDLGYCNDVTSSACPVRDFWPRFQRAQAAGTEAYYFVSGSLQQKDRKSVV